MVLERVALQKIIAAAPLGKVHGSQFVLVADGFFAAKTCPEAEVLA